MENRQKLDGLFQEFRRAGRDILIINDVSIYLQAGDAGHLLEWMSGAATVVANGYYGRKLGTGVLSLREAGEMERLIQSFPCHIGMPHPTPEKLLGGGIDEERKS
jgi:hypothetical protein